MDNLSKLLKISNNHPKLFDKYAECLIEKKEKLINNEIFHQIFSLLELPKGWNYGNGEEIKEEAALVSFIILESFPGDICKNIEAFPLSNGGISLRIYCKKNLTIGLLINSENDISTYIDNGTNIKDAGIKEMSHIADFLIKQNIEINNVEP